MFWNTLLHVKLNLVSFYLSILTTYSYCPYDLLNICSNTISENVKRQISELVDQNLNDDSTIHFGFCKIIPSMLRFFIFKMSIVFIPWVHRVLFPSLYPEVQSFISSRNFKPNILRSLIHMELICEKGKKKFQVSFLYTQISSFPKHC